MISWSNAHNIHEYKPCFTALLQLSVWNQETNITLFTNETITLTQIKYLDPGMPGLFVCTRGKNIYSVTCGKDASINCNPIYEDTTPFSTLKQQTIYEIDKECLNDKAELRMTKNYTTKNDKK